VRVGLVGLPLSRQKNLAIRLVKLFQLMVSARRIISWFLSTSGIMNQSFSKLNWWSSYLYIMFSHNLFKLHDNLLYYITNRAFVDTKIGVF